MRNEFVKKTLDKYNDEMKKTSAISFGRWLLKYATPEFDNNDLCWRYNGLFYNTNELYHISLKEPCGSI